MKIPKDISKKCLDCGVVFCKKQTTSKKKWATMKYCGRECSLKHTSVKVLGVIDSFSKGHTPWNKNVKGIKP